MPVPITGLVTLLVVYVPFVLYAFTAPSDEERGWPWLRRASTGYASFAALVIAAMWTGRSLDETSQVVRVLSSIGLGPSSLLLICPGIGAGIGWIVWRTPALRRSIESLWLFVFEKERERFGFYTSQVLVVWALLGFIFAFIVVMNVATR